MILIFNVAAVLPVVFGGMLGFLVAQSSSPTVAIVVGALTAVVLDAGQRWLKRDDNPFPLLNTQAGGHLFFIPVWGVSVMVLIMTGLVKLGAFSPPPDPARDEVARNRQQAVQNRQQAIQNRQPAVQEPGVQEPGVQQPGVQQPGVQQPGVQQPGVQQPPAAIEQQPAKAFPLRGKRKGPGQAIQPAPAPVPQRRAFAQADVKKIALQDGSLNIQDRYTPQDATDRDTPMPVKIYELAVDAGKAYWLEVTAVGVSPGLRVESLDGRVLAEGARDSLTQPARLVYVPAETGSHRIITSPKASPESGFSLAIRALQPGDSLPERDRVALPKCKQEMRVALQTKPFLAAAIAADCQSAWVAYPAGNLERFSCPDFAVTASYKLPRQAYLLAINGRGMLCAAVQRSKPAGTARKPVRAAPGSPGVGPADLHLYNTLTLSKGKQVLTPKHVVSLGTTIESLVTSGDDAWLYFLDTQKRKLRRVNLETGKLDKEAAEVAADTKALCLTPDGKALYTCAASNVVQKFDPVTLQLQATIRIDKGAPTGIQATDRGDLFLNSGESQWTHIFLVNANRDYADGVAKVTQWAGVYRQSALVLSGDQSRLYSAGFNLSPAAIKAYQVPAWPGLYRARECGSVRILTGGRGTMAISRDGRFLFCDAGLILTLE